MYVETFSCARGVPEFIKPHPQRMLVIGMMLNIMLCEGLYRIPPKCAKRRDSLENLSQRQSGTNINLVGHRASSPISDKDLQDLLRSLT